jgi:dCMP deaminase
MTNTRLSWTDYFKKIAIAASERSPCERLKVGCVIVKDNQIMATGYNGFLSGAEHKSVVRDDHEMMTVHSEQNAIASCAKRGISAANSTAYITHYPCINCCKILLASGITEILYIDDYKNDPLVITLCESVNVKIDHI